jgi:general secretion pathway protein G
MTHASSLIERQEQQMKRQKFFGDMNRQDGVTFLELLIALVVVAILAAVAIPAFGSAGPNCDTPDAQQGPLMRAKIGKITGDIGRIHLAARSFDLSYGRFPDSLAEIGLSDLEDPWGNPYQYLVVLGRQNVGPVRKDQNLKPVNSGYDVYSMGPDGKTASPFTSTVGADDIVMANDGAYFGLACQYNGSGNN